MSTTLSHFGPEYQQAEVGTIVHLAENTPLKLDCGVEISNFPLAYQTYGVLNAAKSNAILICHALTADQYVAGMHPVTGKPGWWERMVGSGKPIDTDKYFLICANVLGGCMGSFGPKEINPATKQPYGVNLPVVTMGDMARAQKLLIEHLGIETLFCVIGASMGGMQLLEWVTQFPKNVFSAALIASTAKQSAQNIAFHEIGRQAIMADPEWVRGEYDSQRRYPSKGLAVARMAAHVTYLSESALQEKFGRALQDRQKFTYGFEADFQIESYLRHQGQAFIQRFDPNSYLYITRAMSYFDLTQGGKKSLAEVFKGVSTRFCVASFTSDWLFPTRESLMLVRALNAAGVNVSFTEIETDKGHDAFLLDIPELNATLRGFLEGCATVRQI